jgi:hypothetical protein
MNSRFTDESLNWRRLCRSAALEQHPEKLSQIVEKINLTVKTRQRALRHLAEARRDNNSYISAKSSRRAA